MSLINANDSAIINKELEKLVMRISQWQIFVDGLQEILRDYLAKDKSPTATTSGFERLGIWEQLDHLHRLAIIDPEAARYGLNVLLNKNAGKLSFEKYKDYLLFARNVRSVIKASKSYLEHNNIPCTLSSAEAKNTHGNFRAKAASEHLVASAKLPLFSVRDLCNKSE